MDGIPSELWKRLQEHHKAHQSKEQGQPNQAVDIVKIQTAVFNDIETYGVSNTKFSLGWMCPIYKKNEKRDIANYRPITVLNSDYKLFTKALTAKLSKVTGRSIFDQIKQTKLLIDYAELIEEDRLIIVLDQEKAYDKITHDYLWQVLEKTEIPPQFIGIVKSLYKTAKTAIINGVISTEYDINRGVCQGDSLSCLLFDLAIEPLAAMLRNSNLEGYRIPGTTKKLITSLFADDTTVYLAKDKFSDLQNIKEWCTASSAKFNIAKTEVIPIGTPEYRILVTQTRKTHKTHEAIPDNIHIAGEREPVRILGVWVGNIDPNEQWTRVLEKIETALDQWSKSHPTMEGRKLIIQMIIRGMTQYLIKAQGMPPEIEKRLSKRIRTFMWDHEGTPPISTTTMNLPQTKGGRKLLNIEARNKAIHLTWLKSYLQMGHNRPTWAHIAD
jgi:hypothetical protein